jgi:iron(III) transport system substrate-binding protein
VRPTDHGGLASPLLALGPTLRGWCAALLLTLLVPVAGAQEAVLNLYSARHYQTDEALRTNFTRQTGIRINRIEAREDELLERIRNEGPADPADVFLTVDAARLSKADELGLFAPVRSALLESRIPAHLRTADWFSFSVRARVHPSSTRRCSGASDVRNYEDLAGSQAARQGHARARVRTPRFLSLMSSLIARAWARRRAEEWARGVVANFARPPEAATPTRSVRWLPGECAVTVSNTYFHGADAAVGQAGGPSGPWRRRSASVWPNQAHGRRARRGVAGRRHARPRRTRTRRSVPRNALRFWTARRRLPRRQRRWPAVPAVTVSNPGLEALGRFKADTLPVAVTAPAAAAQRIYDRVAGNRRESASAGARLRSTGVDLQADRPAGVAMGSKPTAAMASAAVEASATRWSDAG